LPSHFPILKLLSVYTSSLLSCLFFQTAQLYGQGGTYSPSDIPVDIRFGMLPLDSQYNDRLPASLKNKKIAVFISGSEQLKFSVRKGYRKEGHLIMKDRNDADKIQEQKPAFYFKIFSSLGKDITAAASHSPSTDRNGNNDIILDTALKVGDFLLVNFYDQKNDSLAHGYYYERIHCPVRMISFRSYSRDEIVFIDDNSLTDTIKFRNIHNDSMLLRLEPDKTVFRCRFATPAFYNKHYPLYYDYKLAKENGDILVNGSGRGEIILQGLNPGTRYQLTVSNSFDTEQEFQRSYSLYVAPYWFQTRLFYVVTVITVILIWLGAFRLIIRRKARKAEQLQRTTEQRILSLHAQLNPHFIFNALSSIQGLNNSGQTAQANQYLGEFSSLLRDTLRNSEHIYNTMDKELTVLQTYLKLEQLRFGFSWEMQIENAIDTSTIEMPTLLLQPLLENAVKHGVSSLGRSGHISIYIYTNADDVVVEISDNGEGFEEKEQASGYGLKLTRERILLMNKLSSQRNLSLIFKKDAGMKVIITFGNWLL
jgi:hypothetical protein